jgi:DNA primase
MTLIKLLNIPATTLDQILEPFQIKSKILLKLNEKEKLNKEKIELPNFPLSKTEKEYLLNRHFNPNELIEKYNIQGGGWVGEWKNRIIIPIYISSKLISWTGRTIIKDREPRYKTLENELSVIDTKKIFFNLDNCTKNYVFLLEGLFDVMRFGNDSICGFGITLTRTQIMYLSNRFKKIFILFDSERQAQKKAREYAMLLSGHGLEVFICDVFGDYNAKDAGDLSPYKTRKLKSEILTAYL